MDWGLPANRERLLSLWAEGLSTAEIGRRMGCSKNAIIGATRRSGLRRATPILRGADHARRMARAGARTLPPLAFVQTLEPLPWKPPPIARGCRWPLWATGAPPTHVYCAAATAPGESWCPAHRATAFIRPYRETARDTSL